jgi:phage terminase small subunit
MPGKSGKTAKLDRRAIFIRQYLAHQNASRAYREAGYKDGPGTRQSAHRLLTSADIQARILEERQKLLAALNVKVEDVLRRFRDIAFADIAEIAGMHIGACRYCYGVGHAYQWRTPEEFITSLARAETKPDGDNHLEGGFGYDATLPPHPDCPMCDGDGLPSIKLKDTRLMTNSERAVFAGIEKTRNGIHYRFHDRLDALKELAEDREANTVASLIRELQDRGQMQRMPLRRDQEPSA